MCANTSGAKTVSVLGKDTKRKTSKRLSVLQYSQETSRWDTEESSGLGESVLHDELHIAGKGRGTDFGRGKKGIWRGQKRR